jgi:hypothetical protein
MSSFPERFKLEGKFTEKWARIGIMMEALVTEPAM